MGGPKTDPGHCFILLTPLAAESWHPSKQCDGHLQGNRHDCATLLGTVHLSYVLRTMAQKARSGTYRAKAVVVGGPDGATISPRKLPKADPQKTIDLSAVPSADYGVHH